jgi:hypothetical protein
LVGERHHRTSDTVGGGGPEAGGTYMIDEKDLKLVKNRKPGRPKKRRKI